MTWVAIVLGIIVFIVVITSLKTAFLNKDSHQKQKLKEIIENYKSYKEGSIDGMNFQAKTTIILMGAKNKYHLASMVKTHATMNMPQDEAEELYQAVNSLVIYIAKNT